MDPLGLALENFNALGLWRDRERGQPIDATGKLLSGESFANIRELKQILVKDHAVEFYRTLTEKLLIYALGRGLEYYDVGTVDRIVDKVRESGVRPSVLLSGIINSAPFQKTRAAAPIETANRNGQYSAKPLALSPQTLLSHSEMDSERGTWGERAIP
jgi:hypothetical protein